MQDLYAIRQISTGFYLPEPVGRMGRGGSHVEPVDCSQDGPNPRLFKTELSAQRALTAWLMGKHEANMQLESEGWEYLSYWVQVGTNIIPQPERKKEDMQIVRFELIELD